MSSPVFQRDYLVSTPLLERDLAADFAAAQAANAAKRQQEQQQQSELEDLTLPADLEYLRSHYEAALQGSPSQSGSLLPDVELFDPQSPELGLSSPGAFSPVVTPRASLPSVLASSSSSSPPVRRPPSSARRRLAQARRVSHALDALKSPNVRDAQGRTVLENTQRVLDMIDAIPKLSSPPTRDEAQRQQALARQIDSAQPLSLPPSVEEQDRVVQRAALDARRVGNLARAGQRDEAIVESKALQAIQQDDAARRATVLRLLDEQKQLRDQKELDESARVQRIDASLQQARANAQEQLQEVQYHEEKTRAQAEAEREQREEEAKERADYEDRLRESARKVKDEIARNRAQHREQLRNQTSAIANDQQEAERLDRQLFANDVELKLADRKQQERKQDQREQQAAYQQQVLGESKEDARDVTDTDYPGFHESTAAFFKRLKADEALRTDDLPDVKSRPPSSEVDSPPPLFRPAPAGRHMPRLPGGPPPPPPPPPGPGRRGGPAAPPRVGRDPRFDAFARRGKESRQAERKKRKREIRDEADTETLFAHYLREKAKKQVLHEQAQSKYSEHEQHKRTLALAQERALYDAYNAEQARREANGARFQREVRQVYRNRFDIPGTDEEPSIEGGMFSVGHSRHETNPRLILQAADSDHDQKVETQSAAAYDYQSTNTELAHDADDNADDHQVIITEQKENQENAQRRLRERAYDRGHIGDQRIAAPEPVFTERFQRQRQQHRENMVHRPDQRSGH